MKDEELLQPVLKTIYTLSLEATPALFVKLNNCPARTAYLDYARPHFFRLTSTPPACKNHVLFDTFLNSKRACK